MLPSAGPTTVARRRAPSVEASGRERGVSVPSRTTSLRPGGGALAAVAAPEAIVAPDSPTPWLELGAELSGLVLGEAAEGRLPAQTREAVRAARMLLARGLLRLGNLAKLAPPLARPGQARPYGGPYTVP